MLVVNIFRQIMLYVNSCIHLIQYTDKGKGVHILSGEIDYTALGARIRESRENANLTQEKLAEVCTLSAAHIGHIERGTRIPSLDTIFKIAITLNISIDVLLMDSYGDENKNLYDSDSIAKARSKLNLKSLVAHTRLMIDEIDKHM